MVEIASCETRDCRFNWPVIRACSGEEDVCNECYECRQVRFLLIIRPHLTYYTEEGMEPTEAISWGSP